MATTITFEHDGVEYNLGYTRSTVKKLFNQDKGGLGFYADMIEKDPIGAVERLGYGAFLANHRFIKREDAIDILCSLSETDDDNASLAAVLMEMVSEAMEETAVKKTGNVKWQVNK